MSFPHVQWWFHKCTADSLYSSLTLFLHWEERETRKHDCEHGMRAWMPHAARSTGVRRWVKRETWWVSYNILDSRHWSQGNSIGWSMTLWCTSVSNLYKQCLSPIMVQLLRFVTFAALFYFWPYNLSFGFMLHTCFVRTAVLGGLKSRVEPFEWAVWKLLSGYWSGFSCILSNHLSHLTGYSLDWFDTKVSYSKKGRGDIDASRQRSI